MKIGTNTTTVIAPQGQAAQAPQDTSNEVTDKVELGHHKSAGRRAFDSAGNGFRTVFLGAGGAALHGEGGWASAGGYFAGTMGGALSGYCAGQGLHDAIKARHAEKGTTAPQWIENAPEVGAAVGAGVGLILTHIGNPLLAGGVLGLSAVVGGYHIDGIQPGDRAAWRHLARTQLSGT